MERYGYDPVGKRAASLGVSSYTWNSSNEKIKSASLQIIRFGQSTLSPAVVSKG
jgi:hypothetical protein